MNKAKSGPKRARGDRDDGNSSSEVDDPIKDPIHVYCRIRALITGFDESCISLESPTTLRISAPADSKILRRDVQYIFKHIFTSYTSQKEMFEVVALPLLTDLLSGKNGLLFTYGITGSGKTYTLTGDSDNPGIMPRCINTLFNTICDNQAPKFVIKSDKLNGFEIQTESDASDDRRSDLKSRAKLLRTPSKERIVYSNDCSKLPDFNEANLYAVFISYTEIYNNIVYDLLEDTSTATSTFASTKALQSKILREDSQKNMYVNGVVEVEVKSAAETFELFNLGQKRKRMAHTVLNSESSRSHSIFSIRLVQLVASHNSQGEHVIPECNLLKISQLSLVDLAGSERSNRTQTTGVRLKEASSINNTLMSLRTCMEALRDNQMQNGNRLVPYRESRLTHLFKNYFEGEGQIKMIVCINPSCQDYEENLHVMKFAQLSQEVKTTRAEGRYTPYTIKKPALQTPSTVKARTKTKRVASEPEAVVLGPKIPSLTFHPNPDRDCWEDTLRQLAVLATTLEIRRQKNLGTDKVLSRKQKRFRKRLQALDQDCVILRSEVGSLSANLKKEKQKNLNLQTKIVDFENTGAELLMKNSELQNVVTTLKQTIDEKNLKINQNLLEREKTKQKFVKQQEKLNQEMDEQLRRQRQHLQAKMQAKDLKLKRVQDAINSELALQDLNAPTQTTTTQTNGNGGENATPTNVRPGHRTHINMTPQSIKRRRSRSVGDVWLEHNVIKPVALGTVLQPSMKKRKSLTKLTKARDVTNPNQSKYCLIAQEPDTDGELETKLYKGDIVPTCGGGAQVIFNDVERLKQESPCGTPRK